MSGKMNPLVQLKLRELQEFLVKVQRVHGLVELYSTVRAQPEQYETPVKRAFEQLKLQLMGAGYDSMAQLAGSMVNAARRTGSVSTKSRVLREGVASLRFQLELESRSLVAAEAAAQEKKELEAE